VKVRRVARGRAGNDESFQLVSVDDEISGEPFKLALAVAKSGLAGLPVGLVGFMKGPAEPWSILKGRRVGKSLCRFFVVLESVASVAPFDVVAVKPAPSGAGRISASGDRWEVVHVVTPSGRGVGADAG
jgi:hypothetical protein